MVEHILKSKGYSTEIKRTLVGNKGADNNNILAVECKNYREAKLVGINEMRFPQA